jgi:hypothetical protein
MKQLTQSRQDAKRRRKGKEEHLLHLFFFSLRLGGFA